MSDTVQKVKDKLSITEVVAPYVKLVKAGRYMKGLSPFTKEKTPSFFVNIERNSYYCFSTGQGGDMFTFIEKMEGVDFKGALKILAEKAGVEIVYEKGAAENKGKLDKLREAVARAEAIYVQHLTEESAAYQYARSRGLTAETIVDWRLGFAPEAWRALLESLMGEGYTTKELIDAGLVKEADEKRGTYYDRFRNRLMFPIRDSAGRTVAFTGRAMDTNDQAKYLNSPESDLFKKSEILFGMDRAKEAIRSRGFAILVEGQFDLVLLHQIGFTNTIALSGTALTPTHLSLIKRYADNLMLALDADRAGLAASAKNAHAALASGMKVKAVRLPEGKDPADIASEDPKEIARLVKESQSVIEFFLSVLASAEQDQHKLILEVERVVLPLIAAIPSPMEREHFIAVVARTLGMTTEAIRASLPKHEGQTSRPVVPVVRTEMGMKRSEMVQAFALSYAEHPLAQILTEEYTRITGAALPEEPPSERILFEAGLAYGESPREEDVRELIRSFEREHLTIQLKEATARLRVAEAAGDETLITELSHRCHDISRRLASL